MAKLNKDTAHSAFINALAEADSRAMAICSLIGEIESDRDTNKDTWGDVGQLCYIVEKLVELEQVVSEFRDYKIN